MSSVRHLTLKEHYTCIELRGGILSGLRKILIWGTVLAILTPTGIVVMESFSNDHFITFPPHSWGVGHYFAAWRSDIWPGALIRSLGIGLLASSIAVLVGVLFVIGVHRTRIPRSSVLDLVALGPIIVPAVVYAIAMFGLEAELHLVGTRMGIVVAHIMISLPFVILILGSAIGRVPRELEEAALSLGATRLRTFSTITLPLLGPAIVAAGLFAFITSFDDAVFVSFLAGPDFVTLPLGIFNSLRTGVDPAITAIGTVLTIGTGLLMGSYWLLRR